MCKSVKKHVVCGKSIFYSSSITYYVNLFYDKLTAAGLDTNSLKMLVSKVTIYLEKKKINKKFPLNLQFI